MKFKKYWSTTWKFLLAAALITWLVRSGRFDFSLLTSLWTPKLVLGCTLLVALNLLVVNERWRLLLMSQGLTASRWTVAKLSLIGLFFNFVVPGGVGGDVVKSFYIAKENPEARLKSVVSVAMDRLVGLYTMLLMALIAMLLEWDFVVTHAELRAVFWLMSALAIGFSAFWSVIFSRRLSAWPWLRKTLLLLPKGHHMSHLLDSFAAYASHKALLFKVVLISFLAQILGIGFFIWVGKGLGFSVPLPTYFFVVPVGFMITAIPLSPGGVGVGQAAFFYLFRLAMTDSAQASSLGTVAVSGLQIYQFMFGLIGAWSYATMKRDMKIEQQNPIH